MSGAQEKASWGELVSLNVSAFGALSAVLLPNSYVLLLLLLLLVFPERPCSCQVAPFARMFSLLHCHCLDLLFALGATVS